PYRRTCERDGAEAQDGAVQAALRHFSYFSRVTGWRAKWIFLEEKSTRQSWLCSIPIREMLSVHRSGYLGKDLPWSICTKFCNAGSWKSRRHTNSMVITTCRSPTG